MSTDVDLSVFDEINKRPPGAKKTPWEVRFEVIKRQFPSALTMDWVKAFDRDIDLFAWIMQDVLKADGAAPGRSGPKPAVDYRVGAARLRQLIGDDYSTLPFAEAFRILAGPRSLSSLAAKTGISRSQVRRLLRGEMAPSAWEMEQVAKGFRKQPGYFSEYRIAAIVGAIVEKLGDHPETSLKYFRELAGA